MKHSLTLITALLLAPFAALRADEQSVQAVVHGPVQVTMDRAAKCCLAWLNPEQHFLPTGGYETAHDTGRWWDAMIRYEVATGVRIPAEAESAMMENLRTLTDNPAALLTGDKCNPHNFRESLLAYTALVRYRKNVWAEEQGRRLVATMASLIEADGQMDYSSLAARIDKPLTADKLMMQRSAAGEWFNSVGSTGRAIEALVWFHEATGDDAALKLAKRLAEVHLRNVVDPGGKVRAELLAPVCISHTHSYCGTLRGLLLYGLATGERKYIDAVANTYRNGLWGTAISHSGWTAHDQGKLRFLNKEGDPIGEHASCGDVAQIALWLALRDGQTDLLDDVERLIRARLLPSQITDPSQPRKDGAWGVYRDPFGQASILDVFAAVLHSLADIQQSIATTTSDGTLSVNLHFDTHTPSVTLRSQRGKDATLLVTLHEDRPLRIRVPGWASRDSVRLSADGKELPQRWDGSFLLIGKGTVAKGSTIMLGHDLPEKKTVEETPVSHRKFHLTWRGDQVIACEPKVAIYPAGEKP